jgi:simple sugar transport system permease protein
MTLDFFIAALVTIVSVTTPILLAATGELVVEKAGVLNLGIEGMMLVGAIAGFAVTFETGNPWLGVAMAAAGGALASLVFGVLVLSLGSNQVATGLALTIFGGGLSSLIGESYIGMAGQSFDSIFPDSWAEDPIGKLFFSYSPLVYIAFIAVFGVYWFLNRTRAGLVLRAVGENDVSARSIGYSVAGVRYGAIAFGGAMSGIAGSYFTLVSNSLWQPYMTAGRGWIALALVVFSGWRTGRLLAGAYFFGLFMTLELYAKASGFSFLPSQFWAAMPYLMAVIVLAIMSARETGGAEAPACLGKTYMSDT